MHLEFRISLDKLDSSAYPEFFPESIDYFLNEAQERLVKNRYGRNNLFRAGFEEIQKRTEDLKVLVVTRYPAISVVAEEENTYRLDLSDLSDDKARQITSVDKYMFYLRSRLEVNKAGCTTSFQSPQVVQQDDLEEVKQDPFKRPSLNKPVIYFEEGNIYAITSGDFTIDSARVTFLKRPVQMKFGTVYSTLDVDRDCELSEHLHKEIVQRAVDIALENIESPRQQTIQPQLNKLE